MFWSQRHVSAVLTIKAGEREHAFVLSNCHVMRANAVPRHHPQVCGRLPCILSTALPNSPVPFCGADVNVNCIKAKQFWRLQNLKRHADANDVGAIQVIDDRVESTLSSRLSSHLPTSI